MQHVYSSDKLSSTILSKRYFPKKSQNPTSGFHLFSVLFSKIRSVIYSSVKFYISVSSIPSQRRKVRHTQTSRVANATSMIVQKKETSDGICIAIRGI
jgi:hypothetical protein